MTGAGDGIEVDFIFGQLSRDENANGNNVKQKLDELLSEYFSPYSEIRANVFGILIAWKNGRSVPYEIKIRGRHPSVVPVSASNLSVGIDAACAIASYLMKKINYTELSWEAATQYAIAVMKEVGKEINGVGRLEEFGFDIIVFLDNGSVRKKLNYRTDSASIGVKLNRIREDVSSEFESQEIDGESGGN